MSALGGLLGLLLGFGLAQAIHFAVPGLPVHTPLSFVLLAEAVAVVIGLAAVTYQAVFSSRITAIFFDPDIAYTSGVNEKAHTYAIVFITAVSIAAAIRLMGAFLMDALILLPAILAAAGAKSVRGMFIRASAYGLAFSVVGSFTSIALDIPVSAGIASLAAIWFILFFIGRRKK